MPYMSGLEFVATLVADQTIPWMPVIFLSAQQDVEDRVEALGGVYLGKPCRADALLRLVDRQLYSAANAAAGTTTRPRLQGVG